MGAAFAAAVLPLVNACSEGSAVIIQNDLAPGKAMKGSYEVVNLGERGWGHAVVVLTLEHTYNTIEYH